MGDRLDHINGAVSGGDMAAWHDVGDSHLNMCYREIASLPLISRK
jgi:hypothetical protein